MHVFCRSQMIAFASNFALLLWWLGEHKETVKNANATQPPLEFLDPHCKYTSASGLAWAFLLMNLTHEGLASVNFILSKYLVWYTQESHNLYIVPIVPKKTVSLSFLLFGLFATDVLRPQNSAQPAIACRNLCTVPQGWSKREEIVDIQAAAWLSLIICRFCTFYTTQSIAFLAWQHVALRWF